MASPRIVKMLPKKRFGDSRKSPPTKPAIAPPTVQPQTLPGGRSPFRKNVSAGRIAPMTVAPTSCPIARLPNRLNIGSRIRCIASAPNVQAQRPQPETAGRLQQSLTNHPNRPPARRGGGSLQRSGWAAKSSSQSLGTSANKPLAEQRENTNPCADSDDGANDA